MATKMTREQYEDWRTETRHEDHKPRERKNPNCQPCVDEHDCDDDSRCGGCVACAKVGRYDACAFACEHNYENYAEAVAADLEDGLGS